MNGLEEWFIVMLFNYYILIIVVLNDYVYYLRKYKWDL